MINSIPLQPSEIGCLTWLSARFLKGGLKVTCFSQYKENGIGLKLLQPNFAIFYIAQVSPDPFNEEKGEARTVSSCPTSVASTPNEHSVLQSTVTELTDTERSLSFLYEMAEGGNVKDDSKLFSFLTFISQHKLITGPPNLEIDHPLEETGFLLLAVLFYHHGVTDLIFNWLSVNQSNLNINFLPKEILAIFQVVQRCKWRWFQDRQKLDRSHKEVCNPIQEKCR